MNCPRWMFTFTYVYLTGEWSFACIYADDFKSAQEKFERIPSGLYFIETIDRADNVYRPGEKNFVPGTRIYDVRKKQEVQMTKEELEEREQAEREELEEREQAEREKHDEMVRELVEQARILLACNFGVIPPKAEINIQEV